MPAARYLLILARLEAERKRKLGVIATADEMELVTLEDAPAALTWLERHDPRVVVFDPTLPKVEKVCQKLRGKKQLAGVPLLALSPDIDDPFVAKLYGMGADDVLPSSAWASLVERIRAVPVAESLRPPPARGRAIVADPDHGRCDVIGRVLMNAGYDVRLALDERALEYYSQQKDIQLVVANADLGSPVALAQSSRKRPDPPVWIITSQRRELAELTDATSGLEKVAVIGAYAPPENLLFTANELAADHRDSGRSSDRVLFGTLVWFRAAGADEDDIGFSYNISRDGLYVRSLAPPEADVLWLEIRPPRSKTRARLEGRVVWRQRFGPGASASGPAGFGVQISGGLGDAIATWHESYEALAKNVAPGGFARVSRPDLELPSAGSRASAPVVQITGVEDPTPSLDRPSVGVAPPVPPAPPAPESIDFELDESSLVAPPPAPAVAADELVTVPVPPPAPSSSTPSPSTPSSLPPAPRRSRLPLLIVSGLAMGAVVAAVVVATRPAPAPPTSAPVETASAAAPPTASAAPPASMSAAPPPSSAPAPSSAAPAASTPVDLSGGDGSDLLTTEGYLVVHSTLDGVVYLSGFAAGPTNHKLKTHCGLRYARVGVVPMGKWLSDGKTVDIKCQKISEVTLDPAK